MFDSKRIGRASIYLAVMLSLAMFFAACTSFHWITPVPSTETPVPAAEAAVTEPAAETQGPTVIAPTVEAIPEMTPEAVAETKGPPEQAEEGAVDQDAPKTGPSQIRHALARREECSDCHAVETGRDPAPADHVNLTDDVCLYCHVPEEGEASIPPLPDPVTTEFCLTCHGTFEELMARTEGYITDDDVEVNPHMYIPHNRTDIRPCVKCHDLHPLPVVAPEEIPEGTIQYCYNSACHHEENFTPCDECHGDE